MKKILYYKFSFINTPEGDRHTNDSILAFHLPMLDLVKELGFDGVKIRPRGENWHRDIDIAVKIFDHCLAIGLECWFDTHLALEEDTYSTDGKRRHWGKWEVCEPLYEHAAVTKITIDDEPKSFADVRWICDQYLYLRQYTDKPLITCLIGEEMLNWSSDPYDGMFDYECDRASMMMQVFRDSDSTNQYFARHYPIRRNRGTVHAAYFDKMQTGFFEFLDIMKKRDGIPVLQGFGNDDRTEKSYWSFPTLNQMETMLEACQNRDFKEIAVYCAGSHKHEADGRNTLLDPFGNKHLALDGSAPVDAFKS